jgi:glycosyltransferase involved in cell wall biosynthesis
MQDKKKVLIICYSFPPYPGIGGRRWGKFAKYFAQQNIECHVISATNHNTKQSEWVKDVQSSDIIVHSVPFRFKYLMSYASNGLLYKISARLLNIYINLTKYSPYYYSSLTRKMLLGKSVAVIKQQNIKTVIVSGDPYTFYYASALKELCNVKLILDYRDMWNDHSEYNNEHHLLRPKQRTFFRDCENTAAGRADLIVGAYEIILEKVRLRSKNPNTMYKHISNGFDPDDYQQVVPKSKPTAKTTIYMGGSISLGAQYILLPFLKAFTTLRELDKALWDSFEIEIEGGFPDTLVHEIAAMNNPGIAVKRGNIDNKDYINKVAGADYGALVHIGDYRNARFITKTYDYFYLRKPIIIVGHRGTVADFIESNNIGFGFYIDEEIDIVAFFKKLKDGVNKLSYSPDFIKQLDRDYNVKNLAAAYLPEIV